MVAAEAMHRLELRNIFAHPGSYFFSSHFAIFTPLHPRLTFFLCDADDDNGG